jgi:two-component system, OmpR family, alkaline phosphatase synthesis response regulator PhoP
MFDFIWSQESTGRKKILIVDDDPNIVETLRDRLEMHDYRVFTASNGAEGIKKAGREIPDVIIMDVDMPVMGGYEMLEDLRKIEECKDVLVIVITGGADTRTIQGIIRCGGMDEYIVKPFEFDTLLKKLESVFEYNHGVPAA